MNDHQRRRTGQLRCMRRLGGAGLVLCVHLVAGVAAAQDGAAPDKGPSILTPLAPGLNFPLADAARGRHLFAAKGCVVCHSVNGVGGSSAPHLDVETAFPYASPFDFAARMWRGAKAMIALQERDIGYAIELSGNELADLSAFAHSLAEQGKFTEKDIPPSVLDLMKERNL